VLSPIWTHDDSEIIVAVTGGLRRVTSDGDGLATPLGLGSNSGLASLSRDGRKLVFQQYRLHWDVWQSDRRNGQSSPLINSTLADYSARFSPTGERVAWTSSRSGFSEIWVCRADGSDVVQLTFLERASGTAMWSPDGATIAFDSQSDDGSGEIFLIDADGGPPRALTSDPADDLTPAWSPNGEEVYFASNRDGEYRIWSVAVEGGEASRVSDSLGQFPQVRADGEFLYFGSWPDSEGRRLIRKRLPKGPESVVLEAVGSWASGRTGLYFAPDLKSTTIGRLDFESGRIVDVFEWNKPFAQIDLSPDEQTILFGQTEDQVDLMLVEHFR
jgi:Tol biopolymer transport system component